MQLARYLQGAGRATLVVGTKADKLSGNGLTKARHGLLQSLGVERMLTLSAHEGRGISELWKAILEAAALYRESQT